jgi:hypothetical protein
LIAGRRALCRWVRPGLGRCDEVCGWRRADCPGPGPPGGCAAAGRAAVRAGRRRRPDRDDPAGEREVGVPVAARLAAGRRRGSGIHGPGGSGCMLDEQQLARLCARPCDVISSCLPGGFGDDPPSGLIVTGRITQPQRLVQQQAVAVAPRLRGRGDRGLPDLTGGPGPRPGNRRVFRYLRSHYLPRRPAGALLVPGRLRQAYRGVLWIHSPSTPSGCGGARPRCAGCSRTAPR